MSCTNPRGCWLPEVGSGLPVSFSDPFLFTPPFGYSSGKIPCRNCIKCRLQYSREWAIRCHHENSLHADSCMITLTYAPEWLPDHGSLVQPHVADFKKRLRKEIEPVKIRTFECGEYGEQLDRPHYHMLIFGYDFPDKQLLKVKQGNRIYTSKILQDKWPFGHSAINAVSLDAAAYVARYIMKKINGQRAEGHYGDRAKEFITMSEGIGRGWIEKFLDDTYKDDFVLYRDFPIGVPRYYDKYLESVDPMRYLAIKKARLEKAALTDPNEYTFERLQAKEQVAQAAFKRFERHLHLFD